MCTQETSVPKAVPNGSGAAAILAAGIGTFALPVLAIAADHIAWFHGLMVFYKPTGPLSGVTTCGIIIWVVGWAVLERQWRKKTVAVGHISAAALALLGAGLLLTFPPLADFF